MARRLLTGKHDFIYKTGSTKRIATLPEEDPAQSRLQATRAENLAKF